MDCLPCFLKQVLEEARICGCDTALQEEIVGEAIKILTEYRKYRTSPEIGRELHRRVMTAVGVADPYKEIKRKNTETALLLYPSLKEFIQRKDDSIYWALKTSATGNIIDAAIYKGIDIEGCVRMELDRRFAFCDIDEFRRLLDNSRTLLIIGDNAGETVFDRLLIEELKWLDITYAVREAPIINDAVMYDAEAAGIGRYARIISSGCDAPGTILEECNAEFLELFDKSDIVISKGQGNYETLSDAPRKIFFLLKAKCPVIAEKLGVDMNEFVFRVNNERREGRLYNE